MQVTNEEKHRLEADAVQQIKTTLGPHTAAGVDGFFSQTGCHSPADIHLLPGQTISHETRYNNNNNSSGYALAMKQDMSQDGCQGINKCDSSVTGATC
jgi:hypothetical protein